jgi:hypothetical protein
MCAIHSICYKLLAVCVHSVSKDYCYVSSCCISKTVYVVLLMVVSIAASWLSRYVIHHLISMFPTTLSMCSVPALFILV